MAGELGFEMFKLSAMGYCCSQILMKMALDAEGTENRDLIRAVGGLCFGAGGGQKTCGALTGGIAVLSLYAAKGSDGEYRKPDYSAMVDEYTDWFAAEQGSIECRGIIGVCSVTDYQTNQSYRLKCGDILVKCYQKAAELLQEHGYEFGSRD